VKGGPDIKLSHLAEVRELAAIFEQTWDELHAQALTEGPVATGMESRIEGAWANVQTAKGTAATTAAKQFRKTGGDVNVAREDTSQPFSENSRFGNAEDYVNTITGNGNPQFQAQPGPLAFWLAVMNGQDSVAAVAGPAGLYDHTGTPATAGAKWFTYWRTQGAAVGPLRQQFVDCRLSTLRIESSSAQKVTQVTPTFVALDPGIVYATDPVATQDTDRALYYTEGTGRFKINGAVFTGHSSFACNLNDNVTPWYGDALTAEDVVFGAGSVALEGITLLVNQQGKDYYDETIYGTTAPAAGVKPRTDLPFYGSYEFDLRHGTVVDLTATGTNTAGTFTVTVDGSTTAGIPYNATLAQTKAALEALPNVVPGDVAVTGTALGADTTNQRAIFTRAGRVVTSTSTGLTGGTVVATNRGAQYGCKITYPNVKWDPGLSITGNPEGGAVELALGAQAREIGGVPIYTSVCRTADSAAYV
jgi:hypothetical protein